MYTAVYSANTLCPLISMKSYTIATLLPRVYQAPKGGKRTYTIKYNCERNQNAKNSVKKLFALSLLWLILSSYYIIYVTENGVPILWAYAGG